MTRQSQRIISILGVDKFRCAVVTLVVVSKVNRFLAIPARMCWANELYIDYDCNNCHMTRKLVPIIHNSSFTLLK